MNCDLCGESASLRVHQAELCEACAKQWSRREFGNDLVVLPTYARAPKKRLESCPFCQAKWSEIVHTGLFGCPRCYAFFEVQ